MPNPRSFTARYGKNPTKAKSSHSEHLRGSYSERYTGSRKAIAGWELFEFLPALKRSFNKLNQ